jgi:hypothetical protein
MGIRNISKRFQAPACCSRQLLGKPFTMMQGEVGLKLEALDPDEENEESRPL